MTRPGHAGSSATHDGVSDPWAGISAGPKPADSGTANGPAMGTS